MSLPGLLVEYLITGAIALFWILYAIGSKDLHQIGNVQVLFLPAAYVVGMVIDFIAYAITYFPKEWIRKAVMNANNDGRNMVKEVEMRVRTEIQMRYKELNYEINMRSSRDRIARGMIVNSVCLFIFISGEMMPLIKLILLLTSVACWVFFEYKSHKYFLSVYKQLESKL